MSNSISSSSSTGGNVVAIQSWARRGLAELEPDVPDKFYTDSDKQLLKVRCIFPGGSINVSTNLYGTRSEVVHIKMSEASSGFL